MAATVPDVQESWSSPPDQLVLGDRDVHVWRISLAQSGENVRRIWRLLSSDEQARANGFHSEIGRQRFTVARGSLRAILARYLEIAPAEIQFKYTDHGKPHLADSVALSRQLNFNLAHSGDLALCALVLTSEIGVDLERIRLDLAGDDIARRFFSATEVACLDRLSKDLRHEAFFNCWTRKEAFIKAKGVGLSLALDQFDVTLTPGEPAALLRTEWDSSEAARWSLTAVDVGPGYAAAVVVAGHEWQLSYWQLPEEML